MGGVFGNQQGAPDQAAPGGVVKVVQDGQFCKATWESSGRPPAAVQHLIPDSVWQTFDKQVTSTVAGMKDERLPFLLLIVTVPGFIALAVLSSSSSESRSSNSSSRSSSSSSSSLYMLLFPLNFLFMFAFLALRYWVVTVNNQADQEIRRACQAMAGQTGLNVEYRSQHTGVCKSKHARLFRGVAISPAGAIGMAMGAMMAVQVPPGAGPGTQVQVQAPDGQTLQVSVPAGVGPGQTFQVQVPARVQVVQATMF